jgi:RIP metalloprotease RseP
VENFREEYDLAHFGAMVPRLKIEDVAGPSKMESLENWFRTAILRKEAAPPLHDLLQPGDIVLKVADAEYPTYRQLRELTTMNKDKALSLTVLRKDEQGHEHIKEVTVTPKAHPGSNKRVTIGFVPGLDIDSPVVARVLHTSPMPAEKPDIPSGATITAVAQRPVQNFFEIASILQENAGRTIDIDYQYEGRAATALLTVPEHEPVHAEAGLAVGLPLTEYTRPYKASNPAEAIGMGVKKVWQFIAQNYITLTRLIKNELPPSALMGPVGIVSVSYKAAGLSLDRYLYFLGLISTALAVMNLLPLPVLDGGHIVFLLIEKITGKPIHEKVLAPIMYVGLAMLLGLILWVSYNDVLRLLYGS